MSINDMMKLQGVTGASRVTPSDHAAAETRRNTGKPTPGPASANSAPASGIAVEVGHKVDPGKPPVETDRVDEIRGAIQEGRYPIVPAEIADAMIAARLNLVVTS